MATLTKSYETVFVLSNKLPEDATAELVKKFTDCLLYTSGGGPHPAADPSGGRRGAHPAAVRAAVAGADRPGKGLHQSVVRRIHDPRSAHQAGLRPVSYTHLDVYKRQVLASANFFSISAFLSSRS